MSQARSQAPLVIDVRGTLSGGPTLDRAVTALRAGEVLVMPTDTVYGIGVLPGVRGATARVFALKGRSLDTPLAVLCSDVDQALRLVDEPGDALRRVARKLWPGPLTLVVPRRPDLGYELGEPATTIGVRCPDHAVVQALADQVGPIATTSANRHGETTPATATAVAELFGGGVSVVLDGGVCNGRPSTVIDATSDEWRALRAGVLSLDAVRAEGVPVV